MTTRANAYAYAHIRNFKRIPTLPANGPSLRALPHDASRIGPLPRAVTNGNNARIGKIAANRCHVGYSAASCAGTRTFCSMARLQSTAGASLSKESTQRNDTTIPEEIPQSSSAEDKDKDEPHLPKGHKPLCPNLLEVEYSIFLLLVNKRISPRDIIIKRSKNQTISSCHVSFPINKTESLTITKASNTLVCFLFIFLCHAEYDTAPFSLCVI